MGNIEKLFDISQKDYGIPDEILEVKITTFHYPNFDIYMKFKIDGWEKEIIATVKQINLFFSPQTNLLKIQKCNFFQISKMQGSSWENFSVSRLLNVFESLEGAFHIGKLFEERYFLIITDQMTFFELRIK